MSLYNMLFGMNSNTDIILSLLNLKKNDIERFRDVSMDAEKGTVEIYTRTGGGNRESYPNEILTSHPNYLKDWDDSYDSTYAYYLFSIPDELLADARKLSNVTEHGFPASIIKRMAELNNHQSDNDKYTAAYEAQKRVIQNLPLGFVETNGHTIVPLSDGAFDAIARECEKYDGKFIAYWFLRPYKISVQENTPRWDFEKNKPDIEQEKCRVLVHLKDPWEIDYDLWDRWKKKYGEKYPKTISLIDEDIEKRKAA